MPVFILIHLPGNGNLAIFPYVVEIVAVAANLEMTTIYHHVSFYLNPIQLGRPSFLSSLPEVLDWEIE